MSRSWERKVRNNMNKLNKQRKKQGKQQIVAGGERADTYKGRSFIGPILLLLFTGMYILFVGQADESQTTLYYVTIGCYIFLALLLFVRRPYIRVGEDYIQTRKFNGDKRLKPADIKSISVQSGYVVIERQSGGNWVFSKVANLYNTDEIAKRLEAFAKLHHLAYNVK